MTGRRYYEAEHAVAIGEFDRALRDADYGSIRLDTKTAWALRDAIGDRVIVAPMAIDPAASLWTIRQVLFGSGPDAEWDADTLDAIADVVRQAGLGPVED